ncbi:MAG: hypothetical protein ACLTDX_05555 [[Clostridium] innocuum]
MQKILIHGSAAVKERYPSLAEFEGAVPNFRRRYKESEEAFRESSSSCVKGMPALSRRASAETKQRGCPLWENTAAAGTAVPAGAAGLGGSLLWRAKAAIAGCAILSAGFENEVLPIASHRTGLSASGSYDDELIRWRKAACSSGSESGQLSDGDDLYTG